MPEESGKHDPPTYFANFASTTLNVDEMTIEFRRYSPPHKELLKTSSQEVVPVPPPSAQDIYQVEPVARVVLTFSAVKALKQYLDTAFPQIEKQRKLP